MFKLGFLLEMYYLERRSHKSNLRSFRLQLECFGGSEW
jgi:hypothetical protein